MKNTGSWHFQFNKVKRFQIYKTLNSVKIQGEVAYRAEVTRAKNVLRLISSSPQAIRSELVPNPKKIVGVNNLLKKHYGENWEQYDFKKFIL